ncbi:MAG: sulfatase-like hydrolase/transferase [Bacteroidetes bacterium]|nr:sulfatase-like hydrolase/transferase [Bacteroidota bacterium]
MKRQLSFFLFHFFTILFGAAIARLVFLIRNIHFANNGFETVAAFWHGIPLDLSVAAYTFIPALILFNLLKTKQYKKTLTAYYLTIQGFAFLVNSLDAELFKHWGSRLNMVALFYSEHPQGAMASVDLSIVLFFLISFVAQLLSFFFILKIILNYFVKMLNDEHKFSWLSSSAILLLLILSAWMMRGGTGKVPINQSRVIYSSNPYLNAASINGLWNLFYYLINKENHVKYDDYRVVDESELKDYLEKMSETGNPLSPPLFETTQKPNIILLVMESLSAETFRGIGGVYDWSPELNKLMDSSFVFSKLYASGNRTDKGLAALISGFPAQPTTSILLEPEKSAALPSVSCLLSENEYQNIFVYGGDISFANMGYYLKNCCFDKIIDKNNISSKTARGSWGYHDQDIFAELKTRLSSQKPTQPFFITSLSLSVHEPYDIPKKDNVNSKMEAAYRYSDSCVIDFVNWFNKTEYYQNTILIITGDHGRDLDIDYGQFFAKQKFHIPAIITGGALNSFYKGKKIQNIVSQTSLMPFILQNLNISIGSFSFYQNPLSKQSFAIYFFDNGFGLIAKDKFVAWDNINRDITTFEPNILPVEDFADEAKIGRIYQQIVMNKFFNLNRK